MSKNKTVPTQASVNDFITAVPDEQKRADSHELIKMMRELTGEEAVMWGPSIIGFGSYHYKYDSGREGDMILTGFSPRKTALTLYIMAGFSRYDEIMSRLGKYKNGKSCLYIKKLDDIDRDVLKELIEWSIKGIQEKYPS